MLYWLVSAAALVGLWMNIKKHVSCFFIWSVTNAAWVYVDIKHGLPEQAFLQAVYFVFSIYGILQWSRRDQR